MNKRGITLAELIVALAVNMILILLISIFFVAHTRFTAATNDNIEVARELRLATNHMTRVLRFAKPSSVEIVDNGYSVRLEALIESGHTQSMIRGGNVQYSSEYRIVSPPSPHRGKLYFLYIPTGQGFGDNWVVIANNITGFTVTRPTTDTLKIQLTASKNGASIQLETTVLLLGR